MTDAYGLVLRELLQPMWEGTIRRRPTLEHLALLTRSQWWSPEELSAFQARELRKLLEHAYANVPHYRHAFDERGLHPRDVRGRGELHRLPLLERELARSSFAERRATRPPGVEIEKMTSGTTGEPLVFGYDLGSEYWRRAVKLRGYAWAGYRTGDPSLHFWGNLAAFQRPALVQRTKIAIDHALKREHFVDCTDRSEQALAKVVSEIRRLQPKVIVCYAQAGVALARHVLETDSVVPAGISLICAAERLFPEDRAVLTRAFGPRVFETYGSREVMLIAAECEAHQGMHVSMDNLIVELVVREGERERPAEPGEVGEVVVTDLHNFGAPFIRYVTGDLASGLPPGRCACGRGLDRLAEVQGRRTDTLHDGRGRAVSGLFFNVIFAALADEVRVFQVVQRRDGSIDLSVVPGLGFDDSTLWRVREHCLQHLPGVALRTHVVPEIRPDPSGKLRVVRVETE